ncbi:potassium transporter Kup [Methylomagnum ishizawai]|uniref:potassium transporter Kup n=1 Tax=Methylomagnum ishizawai TaxID=1760988 RepID=UPI001C326B15|nr:potassium transporter Kup [Methylomagnum ishizawai]BBL77080.1 putative potassium transport system protein kup [Methylomagnum ishizawai]
MKNNSPASDRHWIRHLALPALGVVFGDIGTSPLYTLRECLNAAGTAPVEPVILGVLSMLFWTLLSVVALKYVAFVMRADNQGEGGIMALLALAQRSLQGPPWRRWLLVMAGLSGAALFYGDGMITPAISVLSAVEGLEVATPLFQPYVIPTTLAVLVGLFAVQRHGTAGVGRYFGPVMLVWFLALGGMGLFRIAEHPGVLRALNPWHAVEFLAAHGHAALLVLGAVVLAVTGAEALYADMGHFGARPIRAAWFCLVLPALALNYFGQGATVLAVPGAARNPFFLMFPEAAQVPMALLATAATVIASQAVISGTYSLTQQAFQLGYLPRMHILHTSETERGQIFLPGLNAWLLIGILVLVLGFQSSSRLAAAYGIAVTGTMLMTSVLFYVVARQAWGWNRALLLPLVGIFLVIDGAFFGANLLKVVEGGWLPLAIGLAAFVVMSTWRRGRSLLFQRLYPQKASMERFMADTVPGMPGRVRGTGVFLAAPGEGIPNALLMNVRHNKILHEEVVVLVVLFTEQPREPEADRYSVQDLGLGFFQVTARFGFMELPAVPRILEECRRRGLLDSGPGDTSYFVSRLRPLPTPAPGMALWREKLFAFMLRNAAHAPDFFQIPAEQVIEINVRVEI